MKKVVRYIIFLVVFAFFFQPALSAENGKMTLSSPAFNPGERIPVAYTCRSEKEVTPPLIVGNIPMGTKSLVLVLDTPDNIRGVWTHWVVFNIDPATEQILEGVVPGEEGINSYGKIGYNGPCNAPSPHRYSFRIYAVDQEFHFFQTPDKENVIGAIKGHVLGHADLVVLYKNH